VWRGLGREKRGRTLDTLRAVKGSSKRGGEKKESLTSGITNRDPFFWLIDVWVRGSEGGGKTDYRRRIAGNIRGGMVQNPQGTLTQGQNCAGGGGFSKERTLGGHLYRRPEGRFSGQGKDRLNLGVQKEKRVQ